MRDMRYVRVRTGVGVCVGGRPLDQMDGEDVRE